VEGHQEPARQKGRAQLRQHHLHEDPPPAAPQRLGRLLQGRIQPQEGSPEVQKEVRERREAERKPGPGVAAQPGHHEAECLCERAVFARRGHQGVRHHVAGHREGQHAQQSERLSAREGRAGGQPGQRERQHACAREHAHSEPYRVPQEPQGAPPHHQVPQRPRVRLEGTKQ
jgi:hypothetical protein